MLVFILTTFFLLVYLLTQSSSVYNGDSGDLVSAALVKGVAHPPGYPLYTFLGWLLTKLPFSTVAWRVGLLSSIFSSATLGLLCLCLRKMTIPISTAVVTTLVLGFSYLFWLYAVVPEVFALHIFLVTLLFYLTLRFQAQPHVKWFYIGAFILGLALSHHQTTILLVPAFLLVWYRQKHLLKTRLPFGVGLFLLGLTPYLYVVWAAHGDPFVNWEDPKGFAGLFRLITRSIYGSFRSNNLATLSVYDRLYHLRIFFDAVRLDFTRAGLILGLVGIIVLFKERRDLSYFVGLAFLLSGPLYLIYAGFIYATNFQVGTLERFFLTPYVFWMIYMAVGSAKVVMLIDGWLRRLLKRPQLSTTSIFVLIPAVLFLTNYPKILPLTHDRTAERFGHDVLFSAPADSILILTDDTYVFTTEYVYLTTGAAKGNRNLKLLNWGFMHRPFYNSFYQHVYPELGLVASAAPDFFPALAQKFIDRYPLLSSMPLDMGSEYKWIPEGLLYRLYKKNYQVAIDEYQRRNDLLFETYNDPLSGALKTYPHLLLSDITRVHAEARSQVGKILYLGQKYNRAQAYFQEAVRLVPDEPSYANLLAEALMQQKSCASAQEILSGLVTTHKADLDTYHLFMTLYTECSENKEKAALYEELYAQKLKETQTELSTL